MLQVRRALGGMARQAARGYASDAAFQAGVAVALVLVAMLWVLALGLLYSPTTPLPTEDLSGCQPAGMEWAPACAQVAPSLADPALMASRAFPGRRAL
ncbi:MAG TPA: hypothetical protein VK066_22995 [Chloroflexota bacterium]|nr:hypothetical protein [Chloroflexota bacterium]